MNKPYSTLFLLALAIALAVGCVFLQEQAAALKSAEAEEVYHPELRDAYNAFGLPNQQSLSNRKLFEGNGIALYPDRVLRLDTYPAGGAQYAAETAAAVLEYAPELEAFYILPIPERAVLEADFPEKTAEYKAFVEELKTCSGGGVTVLDPLPELLAHQDEYIHFRTENSWTMRGAFYGAQVFRRALGYEDESLDAYRVYVFGRFSGGLNTEAQSLLGDSEWSETIADMESDPFFIHIKGDDPNRQQLTFENSTGEMETIACSTIQMNSIGPSAVIGSNYCHSIVEGKGEGSLILIADSSGQMLISYLTDLYGKIYVVNGHTDGNFMQDLNTICSSLDVHQVLWAQRGFRVGNRSYMKALNPFMRKGG